MSRRPVEPESSKIQTLGMNICLALGALMGLLAVGGFLAHLVLGARRPEDEDAEIW
jgi:hypothetical protein